MSHLSLAQAMASQHLKCSLCTHVIEAGEIFWRAWRDGDAHRDVLWLCTGHISLNATGMIIEPADGETSVTYVRDKAVDVKRSIIPRLLNDSDAMYNLTPEEFEELIFDRILAMGLQGFRTGPANRRDGGVDIVFWTQGLLPMLGAVQVKHHRSPATKVGPADVRELAGAMEGHHFNVGLIVTNTSFTDEARHQTQRGTSPIQLRDGEVVRKWVCDDFSIEKLDFVVRNAEFCRGLNINLPQFL